MPLKPCRGCDRVAANAQTRVRIYRHAQTTEFQVRLCALCYGAMLDLWRSAAESVIEGLPFTFETWAMSEARKGLPRRRVTDTG